MEKKDYLRGERAREAMIDVAVFFKNVIGSTMGPAGRNYMLPDGTTNDGKTIAYNLRYGDECRDDIALSLCEGIDRTDREAGDGTSTCTVMEAVLAETVIPLVPDIDAIAPGARNVMQIMRDLDEEKDRAVALIEGAAKPITSLDELKNVALTSAEDKEAADLIAETVWEAGKDAYISVEEGIGGKLSKSVFRGMRVPARTAGTHAYTDRDKREAAYQGLAVLVVDHAFEEYSELKPFLQSLLEANNKKQYNAAGIVIVARHFSIPFVGMCANTMRTTKFPYILLEMDGDPDTFRDLAEFLDAEYIDTHPRTGRKISEAQFKHTGKCAKVIASPKETVFIGGRGLERLVTSAQHIKDGGDPTNRVEAHIAALKAQLDDGTTDAKKADALKLRMAKLSGGIATIYVDAQTAQERFYLREKVKDAINACKSALGYGVIKGGGLGLKEVAESLGEEALLYPALMAPYNCIQQNAGGSLEIPDTVVDSAFSAMVGLKNAVSIVKLLVTTEGIISNHVRNFAQELGETVYAAAEGQ